MGTSCSLRWRCSIAVECLSSTHKTVSLLPSNEKKPQTKHNRLAKWKPQTRLSALSNPEPHLHVAPPFPAFFLSSLKKKKVNFSSRKALYLNFCHFGLLEGKTGSRLLVPVEAMNFSQPKFRDWQHHSLWLSAAYAACKFPRLDIWSYCSLLSLSLAFRRADA